MVDDDRDPSVCSKCEYPFLTSMQHRPTMRWAAYCANCGYTFWIDTQEPVAATFAATRGGENMASFEEGICR